jgi:hypothetical protein
VSAAETTLATGLGDGEAAGVLPDPEPDTMMSKQVLH